MNGYYLTGQMVVDCVVWAPGDTKEEAIRAATRNDKGLFVVMEDNDPVRYFTGDVGCGCCGSDPEVMPESYSPTPEDIEKVRLWLAER